MSEEKATKKKTSPLVFVGIGCLVLLVLAGIGAAIVMKFFSSKMAGGMMEKVIESGTGVKTNIEDLEQGKMTFTDPKTGASVNVGTGTMPDNFPKDFPIYPGAKVTSSMAGGQSGQGSGFWLTLTTSDSSDKVTGFYKTAFTTDGWTTQSTYSADGTTTQTVKKGDMSGSVSIVSQEDGATQIIIVLGEESN